MVIRMYGSISGERPTPIASITARAIRNFAVALVSSAVLVLLVALVWCSPGPERLELQETKALVSQLPDEEKEVTLPSASAFITSFAPPSEADVASFKPKASLFCVSSFFEVGAKQTGLETNVRQINMCLSTSTSINQIESNQINHACENLLNPTCGSMHQLMGP
jgi:hypothetical protein